MGVEECIYSMPAELDIYMKDSIFHELGFCSTEEHLKEELAKAEESHRNLALSTQLRVRELEKKGAKSKEEAVLNAQALKRQVAEGQKLTEQYRLLKDECSRLQQESSLYHNDRDVFMEAAYEAEDRAAEAEDRAAEAEKREETLAEELEQVKHRAAEAERRQESLVEELEQVKQLLEDTPIRLKMDHEAHVATLNSRISELEQQTVTLQEQVSGLRAEIELTSESPVLSTYVSEKSILPDLLSAAKEQHEEISQKLKTEQETADKEEVGSRHDELAVHQMVSSAVTAGVRKSLEGEKKASLRALNLEFAAICRCMESELCGTRERVKLAEMNVQALVQEVQGLRDEASLCRGNLDKAEIEVQMLADENKELRILLRRRYAGPDSPKRYKGSKDRLSQSGGGPRIKTYDGHGDDSVCVLCKARQPLMPLPANLVERKLNRCQNSAADGILFSPNSPSFKEPDLCFRIESPF